MIGLKEIEKLALLARVNLKSEEKESLSKEMNAILEYVGQIQNVYDSSFESSHTTFNVLREDDNPHESGIYTEALLNSSPKREKDFIKVNKIL